MMARWIRLGTLEPFDFAAGCAGLAAVQASGAAPALLWAQADERYLFALVAPRKHAPGRSSRWLSWALAPAIATYRQLGLPAYLQGDAIWLHGRRIAESSSQSIGECAVVASSFLRQRPLHDEAISSRDLQEAFRLRLEAQHGWQFDTSWPTDAEKRPAQVPSFS
ncbi:MAG TPA: hypothetical protein VM489_15115 [Burkholderiales bacterium]|nr:hypothetical protein [Burkholderiales bacterium]